MEALFPLLDELTYLPTGLGGGMLNLEQVHELVKHHFAWKLSLCRAAASPPFPRAPYSPPVLPPSSPSPQSWPLASGFPRAPLLSFRTYGGNARLRNATQIVHDRHFGEDNQALSRDASPPY